MNIFGFTSRPSIEASNYLQIFIRTNVGEQVSVALEPSWTVQKIKSNLAKQLKTNEDQLRIIFAGKELPDSFTISECDIGNRSVLHVVRVERKPELGNTPKEDNQPLLTPQNDGNDNVHETINSQERELSTDSVSNCGSSEGVKQSGESSNVSRSSNSAVTTTRLLCDSSTVMTIQLTQEELKELNKLKAVGDEKPHFYVYCISPCATVCIGKLRVRCSECKSGALTVHRDPTSWHDVLRTKQITATCENPDCNGAYAEFFFKCREHETKGEDDTAVVLYLIRSNLPGVSCLACTDVSSPIVVFQCQSAHVMCLDCFVTYCVSRLNERQFICDSTFGYTLSCPVGCPDSLIEEVHHFKLMGDQHYERYQRFATEEAIFAAGGVLCPFPGCGQGILPDSDCRRVKCVGGCEYVFCKDCLQGYHIGECSVDDPSNGMTNGNAVAGFSVNPERAALSSWDEASNVTIKVISKPCPKCRTPTERDGGCMHMVCTRASCQFHWCWVCQTEWTRECMAAHWFG
ncbi:E3 ubiquitin-protein ligase parkin [Armadillidium nasatum]|uniref:E3 ubiquitin-protein ligase parkin n=1 Tax=Armadillidium nasatum TaxID=96803 RepID=A0A5N5SXD1_9CRUS|nr:E3 ubiquitin-protein ligase parkin [Armadillidium nasatum]